MPLDHQLQEQIGFFIKDLIRRAALDKSEKEALDQFFANKNPSLKEIQDFQDLTSDSGEASALNALKAAILYAKKIEYTSVTDFQYMEALNEALNKYNIKFDQIINISHLSQYSYELFAENNRQHHDIYDYDHLTTLQSPAKYYVAKTAVVNNHIIDDQVINTMKTPDKWRFIYHRVNNKKSLYPEPGRFNDVWVVLAISPKNEVICLDPNGIEHDKDAVEDILQVTKDIFTAANIELTEEKIDIKKIRSNGSREDSALSCCFAVQDLARDIFAQNSGFNKTDSRYSFDVPIQHFHKSLNRSLRYSEIILRKNLMQEFNSLDFSDISYKDGILVKPDRKIVESIITNYELLNLPDDDKTILLSILDFDPTKTLTPEDQQKLTAIKTNFEEKIKEIDVFLKDAQKTAFEKGGIPKSKIITDTEIQDTKRYDEAKSEVKKQLATFNIYNPLLKKGLIKHLILEHAKTREIESFKTKEKPKTVISEILANEDNTHLHLVKEQFAKDFQDDKDEITAEDLEQKTITIKHDPKKHFFNIKDGTIDPASFNKQKYKIYTSVFYFLGDIEESKLKTMQTIFPNTLSENKIKTELQSIPYYNHQSELESEEPANIKEHPELTLKDVKSFLEFRKLQHKHPTDQEFKDYIEEVIASKEALKDIPLNIATNATAIILHQEKQPHQNSGGSLGGR